MPKKDKERRGEIVRGLTFLSQVAFNIVACIAIGVFLGKTLDDWLGSSPWLLLVFSLLGAAAAFKSMFDLANKK